MSYLTTADYKTLILDDDLDVVQQADVAVRNNAELAAESYFKSFIRGRYDVDALFNPTLPDERDPMLVQFLIDEVLYNLHSALPGNMMPEIRSERKDKLDTWLKGIRRGDVEPDWPTIDDDWNTDLGNPVKFGGNKKLNSTW